LALDFFLGILGSLIAAICFKLGPDFLLPLDQGISISFLFVALIKLVCILAFPTVDQYFTGTLLYFGVAAIIVIAMAISIPFFFKNDFI
jgi:hypothetical protein